MTNPRPVPPSIHEALIDRHFASDAVTRERVEDSVIEGIREAMVGARLSVEKARRVADVIMRNEMKTVAARHRQTKDETWKIIESALRRVDGALDRARREMIETERRTSAPPRPTDASGNILAGEIRTRLASMKAADRKRALEAALADGDDTVIGAVLNAPPMLSGTPGREAHDILRTRWRQIRHGADVDRLSRLERAVGDLERAGQLAITFINGLSDSALLTRAAASERAVDEALKS